MNDITQMNSLTDFGSIGKKVDIMKFVTTTIELPLDTDERKL